MTVKAPELLLNENQSVTMEAEIITALFHNGLAAVTFQDITMGRMTAVMSANQAIEPVEIIAFSGRQISANTHTSEAKKEEILPPHINGDPVNRLMRRISAIVCCTRTVEINCRMISCWR